MFRFCHGGWQLGGIDIDILMLSITESPIRVSVGSSVMGGAILRDHCFDPSEYANYTTNIPHTIQIIRDGPGAGGHWDFVMIQDQSGSWFQLGVDQ